MLVKSRYKYYARYSIQVIILITRTEEPIMTSNKAAAATSQVIDPALATAGKPCNLGSDLSKYLECFKDWYKHNSLLQEAIG